MFEGYTVQFTMPGMLIERHGAFTSKAKAIAAARGLMKGGAVEAVVTGSTSDYGPFRVAKWIRKVDGKVMRFTTDGWS